MNKKYIYGTLAVILASLGGWVLYSLLNQGLEDILLKFGISNFYLQGVIILFLVSVILVFLGTKKIFKKLID